MRTPACEKGVVVEEECDTYPLRLCLCVWLGDKVSLVLPQEARKAQYPNQPPRVRPPMIPNHTRGRAHSFPYRFFRYVSFFCLLCCLGFDLKGRAASNFLGIFSGLKRFSVLTISCKNPPWGTHNNRESATPFP
jgi:hypothetical protein